jgi:hypothetical protein
MRSAGFSRIASGSARFHIFGAEQAAIAAAHAEAADGHLDAAVAVAAEAGEQDRKRELLILDQGGRGRLGQLHRQPVQQGL